MSARWSRDASPWPRMMAMASSAATSSCTSGGAGQAMERYPSLSGSRLRIAAGSSRRGSGGLSGAGSNALCGQAKSFCASCTASASRTSPTTTSTAFSGRY